MTLLYPYVRAGEEQFPRPLVEVIVAGETSWATLLALLDTGAELVVIHDSVARMIGAEFIPESAGTGRTVTGEDFRYRFAAVTLELKSGEESWRWAAKVAVTKAPLQDAILGFAGCLQYFDAKFLGREYRVELEWNGSYKPPT